MTYAIVRIGPGFAATISRATRIRTCLDMGAIPLEEAEQAMTDQKSFSGWAYITRAPDVEGCWLAHFLDFNIMSLGDSPQHALEMVREAAGLALADDLNTGRDPHERRADEDDWAPLLRLFDKHTKVQVGQLDQRVGEFKEFAAPVTVVLRRESSHDVAPNLGLDLHADGLIAA